MTEVETSFEDDRNGKVIPLFGRVTRDAGADVAAHLALDAAGLGAWEIVPVTGESRWSPRAKVLLGFRADEEVTYEQFLRSLRAGDRLRCVEAFLRVIQPQGEAAFRIDVQIGKEASRRLALTGAAYIDDTAAVRLVGTIRDLAADPRRDRRGDER